MNDEQNIKKIITGIKPSGNITLGNYLGIIKPLVEISNKNLNLEIYFFIADLHAITIFQKPEILKKNIIQMIKICLSVGFNMNKVNFFIQSDIKEHPFLSYIMECTSYVGEMHRMINYKQTKNKKSQKTRTALLTYPALMASDILLYNTDYVLVGKDQKQHLELTNILAKRFNSLYNTECFKIPKEIELNRLGTKIKSLSNPLKKMSKNDPTGCLYLLDNEENIKKKVMSATTDSENSIYFMPDKKPGISNLIIIYAIVTNISIEKAEKYLKNNSYSQLKNKVIEILNKELMPIQKKFNNLDNLQVKKILSKGMKKINIQADEKILQIKKILGLGLINEL